MSGSHARIRQPGGFRREAVRSAEYSVLLLYHTAVKLQPFKGEVHDERKISGHRRPGDHGACSMAAAGNQRANVKSAWHGNHKGNYEGDGHDSGH
jgi:hypothetical protein